jgi:putative SOS response-associated peptidase YedK
MCGRFTLHSRLNLLLQQFALQAGPDWAPRYNIAPTQSVPIVRIRPGTGQREMALLRWGLVPSWAKDISIGSRMINARAETVATKPSFRAAFKHRRCLVPADGYYEWQKTAAGKQPYYIHFRDDTPFALAGLWESWRPDEGDALATFTIITTDASAATSHIHDRMPVILDPDDYPLWLDPEFEGRDTLQALLRPYAGDELQLDPVSTHVNSPRNDDPQCVAITTHGH